MNRRRKVASITATVAIAGSALTAGIAGAAGGDPDAGSFAATGFNSIGFSGNAPAAHVGLQSGGKIVTAGVSGTATNERATLARFGSNGLLDSTFNGTGSFFDEINFEDAEYRSLAVQSDDQLVAGGVNGETLDFALMTRHAANGTGDPDFIELGSGISATASEINDVVISGGRPVGVGMANVGNEDFFLVGLTSGFNRDPAFGPAGVPDGVVVNNISALAGNAPGHDSAEAVAVNPGDGDLIVVGSVDPSGADASNVAVARFNASGTLEGLSAFGGGLGAVSIDVAGGESDVASDVVVVGDKILVTGIRFGPGGTFDHFVMRLNLSTGALDTTFGDGADGKFLQTAVSENNTGTGLAVTPEGKIYVGGTAFSLGSNDWVLARYTDAGLPDTAFGGDGSRTYSFDPDAGELNQVLLQPDGKVVGAGAIDGQVAVGRFKADDPPIVTPPVVNPPVVNPVVNQPVLNPAPKAKKCKKGQKLKKGKCVKKKRRKS